METMVIASAPERPSEGVELFLLSRSATQTAVLPLQRIFAREGAVGWFGAALSLSDVGALSSSGLAVGAPHDDEAGLDNGYVDLYQRGPSLGWTYRQTVTPTMVTPPPVHTECSEFGFGRSVQLAGDDLAVGAGRYAGGYGRVFLFHRNAAGSFQQVAELKEADDVQRFDANFGATVRLDHDTLLVTRPDTPAATGPGCKSGKVYVYVHDSAAACWKQQQILEAPGADGAYDGFGSAVAIAGDRLAVRGTQAVWLFQRSVDQWRPIWKTTVGPGAISTLALGPTYLAVGDPAAPVGHVGSAGITRLFELPQQRGREQVGAPILLTEPTPGAGRGFGTVVVLSGSHLLMGVAPDARDLPGEARAYVQDLTRAILPPF